MTTVNPSALFAVTHLECHNLQRPTQPGIHTGIGFFNHMLDQWQSHGQLGIAITVAMTNNQKKNQNNDNQDNPVDNKEDVNCYGHLESPSDTNELFRCVGHALGTALKPHLDQAIQEHNTRTTTTISSSSTFACPLDEALVSCRIRSSEDESTMNPQQRLEYNVAQPFLGKYQRTHVGQLPVAALVPFWTAVAQAANLSLSFTQHRGDNAHHVLESSFKAFARATRNFLDGMDTTTSTSSIGYLYAPPHSPNYQASVQLQRTASVKRKTKETSIAVELHLHHQDAANNINISTGIPALDVFWTKLAESAHCQLHIACQGDLWIDEHHTAEDVAIAVGQCFEQALGSKAGLNRMWSSWSDDKTVQAVLDLSNRPCVTHNLHFDNEYIPVPDYNPTNNNGGISRIHEKGPALSSEMFEHVLESFLLNARWTAHLLSSSDDANATFSPSLMSVAQALGQAIFYCTSVDVRRAGTTASSKGTLSV